MMMIRWLLLVRMPYSESDVRTSDRFHLAMIVESTKWSLIAFSRQHKEIMIKYTSRPNSHWNFVRNQLTDTIYSAHFKLLFD
jgi:hypothetical protein